MIAEISASEVSATLTDKARANARSLRLKQTYALLLDRFPDCFTSDERRKRPLAIGIHRAVLAKFPDLTNELVGRAVCRYVIKSSYQRCLKAGATRIDLDGQPAGIVSEEDAEHALGVQQKIREFFDRRQARKKADKVRQADKKKKEAQRAAEAKKLEDEARQAATPKPQAPKVVIIKRRSFRGPMR